MRHFVLLTAADLWQDDLVKQGLTVKLVSPDPESIGLKAFVAACEEISKCGAIVVDITDCTCNDMYFCGLANGLGIQVIGIGEGWFATTLSANPRNVCYDNFEQANERYFSTGRAAQGKEALR